MEATSQKSAYDHAVVNIAQGNTLLLAYLYAELKKPVFILALSIVRDYAAAEDILQETFLRVQTQSSKYQPGTNARAWILSIARNLSNDYLRSRYREFPSSLPFEDESEPHAESFENRVDSSLDLLRALNSLNFEETQILILHAVVGFKHREIAEIVNLSPAAVRKAYGRVIGKLRQYYKVEAGQCQK